MWWDDFKDWCIEFIIGVFKSMVIIVLIIVIIGVVKTKIISSQSPDSDWNNRICPECEVRYEMKSVDMWRKYYVCPECGKEAERY